MVSFEKKRKPKNNDLFTRYSDVRDFREFTNFKICGFIIDITLRIIIAIDPLKSVVSK